MSVRCEERHARTRQRPNHGRSRRQSPLSATLQANAALLVGSGRRRFALDGWTLIAAAIGLFVAIPVGSVIFKAIGPSDGIWSHLVSTVLWVYAGNTLWLMLGVGVGTIVIGTSTAWLVTMYRFPGRRVLSWALLLPLAVPSYILAFVITDQLEYAGNVQSALRGVFGWTSPKEYWFPEIRSLGGATVVLSLVLYPYVYLLARAAFIEQSFGLFETSRTLGRGPVASFFTVALPLARPAIAVGVALALMETLNEYGTIDFFAVPTLTAGIFDVWLNMDSTTGAAQLASVLVAFTLVLVVIERTSRSSRRYHDTTTRVQALPEYPLSPARSAAALFWCAVPVALGFVLPACVLGSYAMVFYAETLEARYLEYVWNSMMLACWAAAIAALAGVALAYGVRLSTRPAMRGLAEFATIGYAVARCGARRRHHGASRALRQRDRWSEQGAVRHSAGTSRLRHRGRARDWIRSAVSRARLQNRGLGSDPHHPEHRRRGTHAGSGPHAGARARARTADSPPASSPLRCSCSSTR